MTTWHEMTSWRLSVRSSVIRDMRVGLKCMVVGLSFCPSGADGGVKTCLRHLRKLGSGGIRKFPTSRPRVFIWWRTATSLNFINKSRKKKKSRKSLGDGCLSIMVRLDMAHSELAFQRCFQAKWMQNISSQHRHWGQQEHLSAEYKQAKLLIRRWNVTFSVVLLNGVSLLIFYFHYILYEALFSSLIVRKLLSFNSWQETFILSQNLWYLNSEITGTYMSVQVTGELFWK